MSDVDDAVRNMLRRATLSGDAFVDANHLRGNFTGRAGETFSKVPHVANYGFHSEPLAGASTLLAALGGRADGLLALGFDDPRGRPSLGPGAVAIYNNHGALISLVQQAVRVVSAQPVVVDAPSMTINGRTVLTA